MEKEKCNCSYYYDCCDCGGYDCGCAYCWSCNACEDCLNDEDDDEDQEGGLHNELKRII